MVRILQFMGSPTNVAYCELSELYARGCIEALSDPSRYAFLIAHVSPDGTWRFPSSLSSDTVAAATPCTFAAAAAHIATLAIDVAVPQMFCIRGMTDMRALLELLAIPYIGNRPLQTAIAANKAMAKAIVAAAGVDVPPSELLSAGDLPTLDVPAVVKPNDADNSDGVALIVEPHEFATAIPQAFQFSSTVLVERYIPLGREVRCGVVERNGELLALPLEEYYVDPVLRPVRRAIDKLKRNDDGDLTLVAKTRAESWIVARDDAIVPAVHAAARRCFRALDSRHYNLFDFRIDPHGRPWFLESGPYCSFAPQSVLVTMMEAAGIPLRQFFAESVAAVLTQASLRRGPNRAATPSNAPTSSHPTEFSE